MTPDEIAMGDALGLVRVRAIHFDRSFVAQMAACARDDVPLITDAQAKTMRGMVHRYKKQLHAKILALAGDDPFRAWPFEPLDVPPPVAPPRPEPAPETPPQFALF